MISNIKTGVIGVGSMGKNHARVYSEVSDLVGVSDLNENLGREIASLYGVKFFSDYKALLKEVEAVTIAVPTKHHLNVSRATIISGTHLLIEKPLSSAEPPEAPVTFKPLNSIWNPDCISTRRDHFLNFNHRSRGRLFGLIFSRQPIYIFTRTMTLDRETSLTHTFYFNF